MLAVDLLVHLHILGYPHADRPEYEDGLFDTSVRGLRERTTSMEQIVYFLVGKIEGTRARTIFPMYPCLQPSDTLSFRNSLTKYLEALRHAALRTGDADRDNKVAWWWKDVIVRKSILEECSGERFERLMVSLSTNALLKCTSDSFLVKVTSSDVPLAIPQTYAMLLADAQSQMRHWASSAAHLLQRQDHLSLLRAQLENGGGPSTYATLSTQRLVALLETKLGDLQRDFWQGDQGGKALEALKVYAGFRARNEFDLSAQNSSHFQASETTLVPNSLSPLPSAAAHHPLQLRKLRKSVLLLSNHSSSSTESSAASLPTRTHLRDLFEKENDCSRTLADALAKCRRIREDLLSKITEVPPVESSLELCEPPEDDRRVNFETQSTPASLSFDIDDEGDELDRRIRNIRDNLTKFPDIPVDNRTTAAAKLLPMPAPSSKTLFETINPQISDTHVSVDPIPRHNTTTGSKGERECMMVTNKTSHNMERPRTHRRSSIFTARGRGDVIGNKVAHIHGIVNSVQDHDDVDPTDPNQDDVLTPRAKTKGARLVPSKLGNQAWRTHRNL